MANIPLGFELAGWIAKVNKRLGEISTQIQSVVSTVATTAGNFVLNRGNPVDVDLGTHGLTGTFLELTLTETFSATGGAITTYTDSFGDSWTVHTYYYTGVTDTFVTTGTRDILYLLVGGGGPGGISTGVGSGGGGGGGGVNTGVLTSFSGTLNVFVGRGALNENSSASASYIQTPSMSIDKRAIGGGKGGWNNLGVASAGGLYGGGASTGTGAQNGGNGAPMTDIYGITHRGGANGELSYLSVYTLAGGGGGAGTSGSQGVGGEGLALTFQDGVTSVVYGSGGAPNGGVPGTAGPGRGGEGSGVSRAGTDGIVILKYKT